MALMELLRPREGDSWKNLKQKNLVTLSLYLADPAFIASAEGNI